jgi:3-oxoacyl-[acyl-carrier-protein] synthase II
MKRVVITGMGVVSPVGNDTESFWQALKNGESGAGPITRFDTTDFVTRYAAEVKDFDPKERIDRRDVRKMDRFSQYSVYAAREAFEQAGLLDTEGIYDPERFGVVLGVGIGGFETIEESVIALREKGPSRVSPMTIPKMISNIGPAHIAINLNAHGPVYTVTTACASATDAIGNAMRHIREGLADIMVAGGAEAPITPLGIAGFNVIQALTSNFNDDPKRGSRPFDKDRDGFLMGEGAGLLVLESLEHARARGAHIIAEVAGNGFTNDANHLTAPHPEGVGAAKAMQMALRDAGMQPEDIDYINAHGTSTPINDPNGDPRHPQSRFSETHAHSSPSGLVDQVDDRPLASEPPARIEAVCERSRDPGRHHSPDHQPTRSRDAGCDLDYVPNVGRSQEVRAVMSNSLGFGGHNGVLVLRKFVE